MADPRLPATLADELATLKRRLAALERKAANTIGLNTMTGSLSVEDSTGVERARLGDLGGNRSGIIAGNNPSGGGNDTFFMVSELGLEVPYIPLQVMRANEYIVVTSGTFLGVWDFQAPIITTRAIHVDVVVSPDAGTNAEVRVNAVGLASTSAKAVPGGTANIHTFDWELPAGPFVLGAGPYVFHVEVRRTSGAGNVYVYQPRAFIGRSGSETPTGL